VDGIVDWYWLGVSAGLGVGAGIPAGQGRERPGILLAATVVLGAAVGLIGALATRWALVGGVVGLLLAVVFLRRLSRDAVLVAVVGSTVLALVPVLGYVEAAVVPLVGGRLRRRAGSRYAGLRILARD
jgi:hypothetical protein